MKRFYTEAFSVDDYVKKYTDGRGYDVVFDTVGGDPDAGYVSLAGTTLLSRNDQRDLTPTACKRALHCRRLYLVRSQIRLNRSLASSRDLRNW